MTAKLPPRLLLISSGDRTEESAVQGLDRFAQALDAGARGVLLREPLLSDGLFLRTAEQLRRLTREYGGWLGIHDRVHLSLACEADGVHLGYRSLHPAQARQLLGRAACIGFSSHAADEASAYTGADYLFHGPIFETPSKQGRLGPVGCAGLASFVSTCGLPVWALGGIGPTAGPDLIAAGAAGIAVLSGILGSPQAGVKTRDYLRSIEL